MANPFTGGSASFSAIDYLAPDVAESQRQLARQQAIADLLRQRALEDDNQTQVISGWAIPQSGFKPFEKLATALMVGKMQQGLDAKQSEIAKRYAEALTGGTSGTGTSAGGSTPSLRQIMLYNAMGIPIPPKVAERMMGVDPNKEIVKVDTGNSVQVLAVDPVTGAQTVVQTVPKGVSPDAQLSNTTRVNEGALDRNVTMRGQNMTANSAALNAGGNGGFGNSENGRAMNMWRDLTLKMQSGQELTPAEKVNLALAERQLMRPQVVGSPDTGISILQPNPLPTLGTPASAPPTAAPTPGTPATPSATPAAEAPQVTTPAVSAPVPLTQPRTEQKILDEARANAKLALPDIEDDTTKAISEVDNLLNDPNLNALIGNPAGIITKRIPGQPAADIDAKLQQIKGGAFLAALQKLKGLGAVSEPEGKAATAAQNRMAEAQSVAAFKEAALEYKKILQKGLKRAREKAGVGVEAPSAPTSGQSLTSDEQAELEALRKKLGLTK